VSPLSLPESDVSVELLVSPSETPVVGVSVSDAVESPASLESLGSPEVAVVGSPSVDDASSDVPEGV
jgi:hypothetical protein